MLPSWEGNSNVARIDYLPCFYDSAMESPGWNVHVHVHVHVHRYVEKSIHIAGSSVVWWRLWHDSWNVGYILFLWNWEYIPIRKNQFSLKKKNRFSLKCPNPI